jgi:ribonucleotide reductase alpha subunit
MSFGPEQLEFLQKKKMLNNNTLDGRIEEIKRVVKKYEPQYSEGLADRIAYYIKRRILSPSTPQWANFGKEKVGGTSPLPASCYITAPTNSIQGIYYGIGETAMMSKLGGGVGADFTNISNKGEMVEEGFYTNSKLDWIEDLVSASQKVSQGSQRRGYSVPFISIDDPEFYDVLYRCDKTNPDKNDPLVNNNVGIIIPIGFRDRMTNGDKEAQTRFLKCLNIREATGKLYLLDVENCNKNQSPVYKKLGHVVSSTNICCVAGDQMVATENGFKKVMDLSEVESLNLFDNEKVSRSTGMILRRAEDDVFEITLKNGITHKVTKDHEVLVYDEKTRKKNKISIEGGLSIGDKVCFQTNKGLFGKERNSELAFGCGELLSRYETPEIPDFILRSDEATHLQFLFGLFNNRKGRLSSKDIKFLREVQIISLNLGHLASIHQEEGKYTLVLDAGFDSFTEFYSSIEKIEYIGREPVYCPTVDSDEHLWICNGVITSNCEITTPKYDDKSFVCVICSLNAVHWDEIKANPQIIKDAYMFLDINVSEFIRLTEGVPFMEKARKSAIEKRDIGLGLLGFHEYLQSKGCAFGDLESRWINKEIFSTMREIGEEYAFEIGEKLGSPAMCCEADMVRRNVSLMMVAPNKSTSFLCDTSLGIEPNFSNYYVKSLAGIQSTSKNKHLKKLLEDLGKDAPEVWNSILENLGSVQHLDFLSPKQKSIFKTASEISPKDIIDLASDRQVYIDMGQSINLFNRPNYTKQDIYQIHKYAFEKGLKTLYYYYPQAHAALEKAGEKWDYCESCAD